MGFPTSALIGGCVFASLALPARAWDDEGHRAVNQLAMAGLRDADLPPMR